MTNNLLKNGTYNLLTGVIRIFLGIATIPVLIRSLGTEEYGLWTLVSTVIGVVTLAEGGLSTSTTIFVSQDLVREDSDSLSQTITISIGGMFVLATGAFLILYFANNQILQLFPNLNSLETRKLSSALQIGGFTVWAKLLRQVFVGIEQAHQRYALINLINTISSLMTSLGMIIIVSYSGKIIELMQWQSSINILFLLVHLYSVVSLLKNTNIRFYFTTEKAIEVGIYSLTIWISSLGSVLFSKVDRLIVGEILGVNVLGTYAVITDVTSQINVISGLLLQPLLPSFSSWINQDKSKVNVVEKNKHVRKAIQLNSYISLVMGLFLLMIDYPILSFLMPKGFDREHLSSFFITTCIYSLYSMNSAGYYILFACKSAKIVSVVQIFASIISIVLIYFASSFYGLIGACSGNIGSLVLYFMSVFAMKKVNIPVVNFFKWISPSVAWFLVNLVLLFLVEDNIYWKILLLLLQAATLILILSYQRNTNLTEDKAC